MATSTRAATVRRWQAKLGLRKTDMPDFVRNHPRSLVVLTLLLIVVGVAHGLNMHGWPGRINDDEGTYVAQAWAVVYLQDLTHYTYWHDHPPNGWLVIALYAWLTDGFDQLPSALMVGREFMLLTNLVCCALLFVLSRRLGMGRVFAVVVVLVFAFSPLAMHFHRMVFLDNIAVAWVLAALVFAASPRRSLAAAVGSGICMAGAILTKETIALLFPVVLWTLVQHTAKGSRVWNIVVFWFLTGAVASFYLLYAEKKDEILAGPGHVSLQEALAWQLFGRPSSGSLLDTESGTFSLARSWTDTDPWLLLGGVALIPIGLCIKQLRPAVGGLAFLVLMMFRDGYMPYPYVIAMLPFAALLIGGVADSWWKGAQSWFKRNSHAGFQFDRGTVIAGRIGVATAAVAFTILALPGWAQALQTYTTVDRSGPPLEALEWITANVDEHDVIIVDDYMWPDLALRGYQNQIWFYKADLDPAVKEELLPRGYASVDYVALGTLADSTMRELPTVAQAINNSDVVATFGDGEITIRKVVQPPRAP